jgi:hypothetical protein
MNGIIYEVPRILDDSGEARRDNGQLTCMGGGDEAGS